MREELVKVEKGYLAERRSKLDARSDEASMESDDESLTDSGTAGTWGSGKRKEREPKIVNVSFNARMSNVLTTCKDLFFKRGMREGAGLQPGLQGRPERGHRPKDRGLSAPPRAGEPTDSFCRLR
jgi:hypothetical protein